MVVSTMRYRVASLAQITRYTNSMYAAVYTLVGTYLSGGATAALALRSWGAAAVVGLVVAYGFVINDYVDIQVDGYSKPHRPIPAGKIAREAALWLALALAGAALLLAASLGPALALFALCTTLLATIYSFALKGTVLWGNACMALLIASIPLYGGLAGGGISALVGIVAGLMWLFDFSHEILKTTADWRGDGRAGLRTVATAFGVRGAVRIFQAAGLLFIGVALLPWISGLIGASYLLALLPCAVLPTVAVIVMLARSTDDATITLALKIMRYMWISNLLPILLMS
ncbi:UbiA family prenyltransferase [Chloroflexales bacterium ZM16-3]|nr:UbiA family prenyltransferase [Chloroflexales bacterium ZM16-3]